MKKLALLICLSIILLILAGCGPQQQVDTTSTNPYVGSNLGIRASFEDTDDEIYLGGGIPILVLLENKGEYLVPPNSMALKLEGISINDFSGVDNRILSNPDEIEKISEFNPDGGVSSVDFGTATFRHSEIEGDKYPANVFIEYVYPYQTAITVTNVCMKGDIRDESVCDISGTKQAYASGAPIQLSGSVEQKRAGSSKIELDIPIKNVGTGNAAVRFGGGGPSDIRFNPDFDEVNIKPSDTDIGWECSAKGRDDFARLAVGEIVTVKCIFDDIPLDQRTIESFTLVLDYYYRDIINKQVLIREE